MTKELLPEEIYAGIYENGATYWTSDRHHAFDKKDSAKQLKYTRTTVTPSDKAAALEAFDYMDKNDLILVMMEYKTGVTYHTDKSIELTGAIKRAALQQPDDGEVVKALEFYADLDNFRGDYLGSGSDGPFSNVSSDQGLKARKALLTYRNKKV